MTDLDTSWSTVAATTASLCALHIFLETMLCTLPKLLDRAAIIAYNLTACAILLVLSWHGIPEYINGNYPDPLFGKYKTPQLLCELMLGYQIYNMAISILYAQLRTTENFIHHTAALVSAYGASQGYVHAYIAYSFGVFESSSILLCFIDIFKNVPTLITNHPATYTALRLVFALQFLAIRIGLIIPFVYLYTLDMIGVYSNTAQHSTKDIAMVTVLYVCCISLTSLQFVWGKVILEGLLKAAGLMGGSSRKRKQSDPELKTVERVLKEVPLPTLEEASL
eukprot:m.114157 g.114157  ORF g.114157 m.114157 type:complete len:280 (-) comp15467_c2_seq1:141-980(-)